MRFFVLLCLVSLSLAGCRLSVSAEKLAFTIQADEPGYLSVEDPTLYESDTAADSNSVE